MKKPTAGLVKIILSVICAAMILGVGVVYAIDAVERNQILGEEEAKTFAYLEAGITDDQVESCRIELEKKAEGYVYELDFIANGKRLEYTVLADNGLVINKKEEYLKSSANSAKKKDSSQQASAQESQISALKTPAQEAAEQKIPEQETTAQKTTVQEASTKKTSTQEAAEQKMPAQETTKQETSTKEANTQQESITHPEDQRKMISIEEVKNIALSAAGVDATGANFTKLKYEKKSGTSVYDLEFYLGNDKHMLIVRADDGVILTHEVVTGSQQSDEEKHQVSEEHPDEDDDDDDDDDHDDDDDGDDDDDDDHDDHDDDD